MLQSKQLDQRILLHFDAEHIVRIMLGFESLSRLFLPERIIYVQAIELSVESTFSKSGGAMPELLIDLERKKSELLEEIFRLRDFRAGSITALIRRCGKATCRCAQPDDPGHGPNLRLTYKLDGKSYSESLPDQAAVRRARDQISEFRKFQRLCHDFVEVNAKICRLRPGGTLDRQRRHRDTA